MKIIIIYMIMAYGSFSIAREINLNSDKIDLGEILQSDHETAKESITIIRDSSTPKVVLLTFSFIYKNRVCSEYKQEEIRIPGYEVCSGGEGNDCHWVSDRVEYRDYCVNYDTLDEPETQKIKLRFRKAAKLKNDQTEIFHIVFEQKKNNSKSINISGKAIKASHPYQIKKVDSIFRRDGLDFRIGK
ncbi:MAG: hypothetical protein AB8G05_12155 [Oligoflexales bacterium]